MAFSDVIEGVRAVQNASGRWMFPCPVPGHGRGRGDNRPSAEVFEDGEDKIGVVCYAGCDNRALWAAVVQPHLGDGPARGRRPGGEAHLIAVYQHPDGRPRKVYRRECPGKAVCEHRKCDNTEPGKHIWQSKGNNAGCYILLWGHDDGQGPVVICEGEKAAAAVAATGYVGASYLGGCRREHQADYSQLRGRRVLVWPDNDDPGVRAAERTAQKAAEWAELVEILPAVDGEPGADAADLDQAARIDHIETGGQVYGATAPRITAEKTGFERPFGDYECTPVSEAKRLIDTYPHRLLITWDKDQVPELYGDNGKGCWSRRATDLTDYISEAAKAWAKDATAAYVQGQIPLGDHRMATAWAKRSQGQAGWNDCLAAVGVAFKNLEREHSPNLRRITEADKAALDIQLDYLGAPNGVIDLNTGELLTGAPARNKLVTRTVPDAYNPDATHPAIENLLAHLPEDNRNWILDALGYALRGNPSRRIYVLEGKTGGGKTTLLNAARACLGVVGGGGYGYGLMDNALVTDYRANANAHSAHLVNFPLGRIATATDLPNRKLDSGLLKRLSGNEPIAARDVGEKADPERLATATLFIAMNPGGLENLDLTDEALFDRVRVLPYPQLPEDTHRDPQLAADVVNRPEIRQAMLALLVRHAVRCKAPPADVPQVAEARRTAREDSLGAAGEWILTHIVKGRPVVDILNPADIWASAVAADGSSGLAWGLDQDGLTRQVRLLLGLPPGKSTTVNGRRVRVWKGWRLRSDEEIAAVSEPVACERCGEGFYPVEGEPMCPECASAPLMPPIEAGSADTLRRQMYGHTQGGGGTAVLPAGHTTTMGDHIALLFTDPEALADRLIAAFVKVGSPAPDKADLLAELTRLGAAFLDKTPCPDCGNLLFIHFGGCTACLEARALQTPLELS